MSKVYNFNEWSTKVNEQATSQNKLSASPDFAKATAYFTSSWAKEVQRPAYGNSYLYVVNKDSNFDKDFKYSIAVYKAIGVQVGKVGGFIMPVLMGITDWSSQNKSIIDTDLAVGSNFKNASAIDTKTLASEINSAWNDNGIPQSAALSHLAVRKDKLLPTLTAIKARKDKDELGKLLTGTAKAVFDFAIA